MSVVLTDFADGVAVITLNRPDARNAVNGDVAEAMEAAIDQMENDDDIWVGIIQANTVISTASPVSTINGNW